MNASRPERHLPPEPMRTVLRGLHAGVRARRRLRGPLRPTWTPELETFAALLRAYARQSIYLPLRVQRRAPGSMIPPGAEVTAARLTPVDAGGVPGAWIDQPDSDPTRVVYYLHGGGYVIGSIESHRELLCRLAAATGARVLAIDYRLAPEHRFPAQLDDALAAYRWLLHHAGIDPGKIAIAGESAGGGLTMSTLVAARDAGLPLPAAAVVLSPWVDLAVANGSLVSNARFDYLSAPVLRRFRAHFAHPRDWRDPLASPVRADLAGLPPLLVHAGGAEALVDDACALARKARGDGVAVELDVWTDMIHAWHMFASFVPEGREALERIGDFIATHTR